MSDAISGLAGVVVLYHPDGKVWDNICSYLPLLGLLVVVDNSPAISESLKDFLRSSGKILYHGNGKNHGIAAALNFGASKALERGYSWLLTMDQDSRFEAGSLETMIQFSQHQKQLGIVSPRHDLEGKTSTRNSDEYKEASYVMTSGNLLNLAAYRTAGPFLEKLFIDYVDCEYCLRLRKAGYPIQIVPLARLFHSYGEIKSRRFLGLTFYPTHHSPERKYYITRNRLYVMMKFPHFIFQDLKPWAVELLKFFLFEKRRFLKLRYMGKGVWDFLRNQYGPL